MTYTYEPRFPPYDHQRRALAAMRDESGRIRESFALFMEMGVGKTKTDIDETFELHERGLVDVWIVIAPKGVFLNWINREIPTHAPPRLNGRYRAVQWQAGGGGVGHRAALRSLVEDALPLKIFVLNVEALSTGTKALDYVKKLCASSRVGVKITVDESTSIKNPSAARSRAVASLRPLAAYRRILTGSPVTKSPLDLYGQLQFLERNPLGFSSFYSFRSRYAVMQKKHFGGRSVQVVVGYREVDDLTKRIAPISFRVKKEDCLDLPPKVYVARDVELTDEQRRIYESVRATATAALDGETHVTATEVITQILRLHQIVCGHATDELGVVHPVANNRVQALLDVVAETDGKVIVWSRYRSDITAVVAALAKEYGPESVVQYHGGVNQRDREEGVARFQGVSDQEPGDPLCRFMVSNAQTGGYGNTWTAASTVVYYSNDYDLEKRVQSEDRAHRSGQTKSVTYVDLVSRGTVDEKILTALRNKIDISSTIMGDGYREWLI